MTTIPPEDEANRRARTLVLVVYGMQAGGLMIPPLPVIGVIISHLKQKETGSAVHASHFRWQTRTFWWTLLGLVAGGMLLHVPAIGALVLLTTAIWYMYRVVRGFLEWLEGRPMYGTGG